MSRSNADLNELIIWPPISSMKLPVICVMMVRSATYGGKGYPCPSRLLWVQLNSEIVPCTIVQLMFSNLKYNTIDNLNDTSLYHWLILKSTFEPIFRRKAAKKPDFQKVFFAKKDRIPQKMVSYTNNSRNQDNRKFQCEFL